MIFVDSDHTIQINVLTDGIPTEIVKRHFYFSEPECGNSYSYEIRTEYNVSRISATDSRTEYIIVICS